MEFFGVDMVRLRWRITAATTSKYERLVRHCVMETVCIDIEMEGMV